MLFSKCTLVSLLVTVYGATCKDLIIRILIQKHIFFFFLNSLGDLPPSKWKLTLFTVTLLQIGTRDTLSTTARVTHIAMAKSSKQVNEKINTLSKNIETRFKAVESDMQEIK